MVISQLIKELQTIKAKHGDIQVTCTASLLKDGYGLNEHLPDVYESTVENYIIYQDGPIGKRVRLYF